MKNQEPKPKPLVTYLRLSDYYVKYIQSRYGSPALFPAPSVLELCLERWLTPNPSMKPLSEFTMSDAVWNESLHKSIFTSEVQEMSEKRRAEFVALVMPVEVIRREGARRVNGTWELGKSGAKALRKQIHRDFWLEFSRFHDDCLFRAERSGEAVTVEDIISDFLDRFQIDQTHSDNIDRSWRRIKKRMLEEIEDSRRLMEQQSGRPFFYTA